MFNENLTFLLLILAEAVQFFKFVLVKVSVNENFSTLLNFVFFGIFCMSGS